ncbi:arylamine N-acetyltransferase [Staphylococcus intermedius]|uniref:N-acetyltransferase family protein n=2 Tax=Staphylococcus intermedius TaxID=1285 RepID=A0A380G5K4_STAIN|nr:arylamine N-acetyltransferase [Staphylococcus intermedius]PCF64071.1 arylamine N-acetyltransferase [Staphylococcus intermedius]PCF78786.1 arylamine N-acetyltransferase [Staphylococcus intermedius]PCF79759.1 arylamine N-acetyltransferase [Staphylococcus intermedius]PCF85891.1 arylamine N-acetyltransferase [Staphylococcus intermedius]PCF89582.1 arylamine N-acetyltransferase [Staphylococcus intermedius]
MDTQQVDRKLEIDEQKQFQSRVEALDYYTQQFMRHVPFENLDVQNGVPISTDLDDLYHKIVEQGRGGYCYEVNTFFAAYLASKGYETHFLPATIHTPNGGRSLEDSHLTLAVVIDGETYIADVGFGSLPVKAIHVTDDGHDTVQDVSGKYRAVRENGMIAVQNEVEGEWQTKFEAKAQPKTLDYFDDKLEYNQHNPKSLFVRSLIVTMPTATGRVTMSQDYLTITDQDGKHKTPVTPDNYQQLLQKYFGIHLKVPRLEKLENE